MSENYKSFVDEYKTYFDLKFDELAMNYETEFMQVSTNLQYLIPSIPIESHEEIFKKMLFEQLMAQADINLPNISEHIIIEGFTDSLDAAKSKPTIFCTYHLGSYRLIASLLARLGIAFTIVMSDQGIKDLGEEFYDLNNKVKSHYNSTSEFNIISAEKPSSILSMIRALKNKHSLLVYIDGNIGSNESTESLIELNFLNSKIFCRKGIATLSYLSKAPIVPVFAERRNNYENALKFLKPILPNYSIERDEYSKATTKRLFNILSVFVKNNLSNWEGWLYVHKFMKPILQSQEICLKESVRNSPFFKVYWQKEYALFDPRTYIVYHIEN